MKEDGDEEREAGKSHSGKEVSTQFLEKGRGGGRRRQNHASGPDSSDGAEPLTGSETADSSQILYGG